MDRTHWFGCWTQHHDCALARIEQLEKALEKIKLSALASMNSIKDFEAQIEFNHIIFEVERMEQSERYTNDWNQVGEGTGETARWQAST